ncbi:uncharacterized protein [Rutidosis leptorrhynchoides]|uniref:uncharacterized protein n=1 Tax=Rutidosis leptorrhynchoides TaxID=125765 RepID=UPI003A9A2BC3
MATSKNIIQVSEIDGRKVNFTIKIKVICLLQKMGYCYDEGKPTLELIVSDEDVYGVKIVINIHNSLKAKFDNLIRERGFFCISNAVVVDTPLQFRTKHIQHEYKLMFTKKTTVVPFPPTEWRGTNGFSFIPFNILRSRGLKVGVPADVIGRVANYSEVQDFRNTDELKSKYINLQLIDLDGLQLDATLRGQFCMDFEHHIKVLADDASVILLIQFGVTKLHQDKLTVSTDWKNTNVLIDTDHPQIVEFRQRLTQIHSSEDSICSLSPSLSISSARDPKSFFKKAHYVGLDRLNPTMEGIYIIQATINTILPDHTWFKVPIRVENQTGTTSFTIFESVVKNYVTPSAYELMKALSQDDDYPEQLELLLQKTLLFKIDVSGYNKERGIQNYTVKDATDDPTCFEFYESFKVDQQVIFEDVEIEESSSKQTLVRNCASNASGSQTFNLSHDTCFSPPLKKIKQKGIKSPASIKSSTTKVKISDHSKRLSSSDS